MENDDNYETLGSSSVKIAKKGIYFSRTAIILYTSVVIAIIVAEGLLVGFLGRPECELKVETTTTKPTVQQTTKPTAATTQTTTPGSTDAEGPWSNIRLPDNLIPDDYDVDLRPVLEPDMLGRYWFYGSTTVRYHCKIPTKYVIIHSNKLTMDNDKIQITSDSGTVAIEKIELYEPNQYLVVTTTEECTKDGYYALTISEFTGELANDLAGLYKSEYVNSEGETVILATTQMEATDARKTFPCFDEPAFKANFTITLWYRADQNHHALSNMPPETYTYGTFDGQEWNATVFQETVPMPTYLLAMIVSDFDYEDSQTSKGVQTRIYGRPEFIAAGDGEYAAQITPDILEFFETYLDVPYTLAKSDQAGMPDFSAGAMENWGLVIYREAYIFYTENVTSIGYKIAITNVIAHELAHQWFGNLVSPSWWDNIWLNEGFATYFSYLGEAAVQPDWKPEVRFISDEFRGALALDSLTASRPLIQSVNTPGEISAMFDTISYSKGGCVVRMVHGFLGENTFVKGLTNYLNELSYGAATDKDLFRFWGEQAARDGIQLPADMATIMETWTRQMGFPVITVRRMQLTMMYTVSQEYFLLNPNADPVYTEGSMKYGYQWYVPFTYKSSTKLHEPEFDIEWIRPGESITISEADFFIANIKATGYYRVDYGREMWSKIADKLDSDEFTNIPEENRAQLLDDAFTLAKGRRLDILIPLDMTVYLSRETSNLAWDTFVDNMYYFDYMLGRTAVYGTFSNYVLEKVVPSLYNVYGWEEDDLSDSAMLERENREIGIRCACYYNYKPCVGNATEMFHMWMENPDDWSVIPSSFRSDILCTAIRNGGTKEWNFAWERHNATNNAQWQASIRYGLGCSKDPWILGRYLEYTLDPTKIRMQDAPRTMEYIGRREYGRDIAWAFIVGKWDTLVDTFGSGMMFSGTIESISRRFSTEYELQLLMDFKNSANNLGAVTLVLDVAMERTKININWRAENEEKVTQWLHENVQNIY